MGQLFRPRSNAIARTSLAGLALIFVSGAWFAIAWPRSNYVRGMFLVRDQPVPFSHEHHVAGLGIDCRYCHTSVEVSPYAGIPPTETCMRCHSQIWTGAPLLEPVRASWRSGVPLHWARVHDLPDYVYFNHAIHVNKGIGCSSCHGRIDQMPLMWKEASLLMAWCLDCHRNPERHLRPADRIYDMAWQPPADQAEQGQRLFNEYHIRREGLSDCYTCHR